MRSALVGGRGLAALIGFCALAAPVSASVFVVNSNSGGLTDGGCPAIDPGSNQDLSLIVAPARCAAP